MSCFVMTVFLKYRGIPVLMAAAPAHNAATHQQKYLMTWAAVTSFYLHCVFYSELTAQH